MTTALSSELAEEAQVVLHVQPEVAHAVPQIGDALDAHPEREPLVTLWVEPTVLQDDRMDHAGAEDRHPARARASRAAGAAADHALDVERDRRLGERVVPRSEAGSLVRPVHGLGELVEEALEVAHRRALVDHEAFDLEELGGMARVDRFVAETAAREQGADGRALLVHDPDLA